MAPRALFPAAALAGFALAQQIGTNTPEVHPLLPSEWCTVKGGCTTKNTSIVLDSQYRWLHTVGGYDPCYGTSFNSTLCPDVATCAKNCALEGVDYGGYGIHVNGSWLTLNIFVNDSTTGKPRNSSPRVYLYGENSTYDMFSLLDKEFAFDVDVSQLPCGTNGALYFSEMLATGGQGPLNPAGAAYGTGYCDAQCPVNDFINGQANLNSSGACCNEMDIWEANSAANALTPHPCNVTGVYACEGDLCGTPDKYESVCDMDGCDFNPYRLGQHNFYQPGANMTVDTTKPFTVVTQFLTASGNGTGDLHEIRRLYVQGGKVIENAVVQAQGIDQGNSITEAFCTQEKKTYGGVNAFEAQGGLKGIGEAIGRGMVLAMSIWDDAGSSMLWLDGTFPTTADPATDAGTGRGPCPATGATPDEIMAANPNVLVKFGNIKSGEIGSTYKAS